jgi:hypothetical protein
MGNATPGEKNAFGPGKFIAENCKFCIINDASIILIGGKVWQKRRRRSPA